MINLRNIRILFLLILISSVQPLFSQIIKLPAYIIETGATMSAGRQTPFWILSDQYGLITPHKYNGWIKLGFKSEFPILKNLDFDYGLVLIERQGNTNNLYLHSAYLRLKFHFINFQAGRIEEKFGDQDSILSSGGLLWSGNVRPMPGISILVPKYTPVPFTKGFLEFKGGISHGWFGNNQFVKNTWLHHKYVYLQFGGKFPVHIHFGLHHYAQWGGYSADPAIGKFPQGLGDFLRVFLVKAGDESAPVSDQIYILGNHLGSRNYGLDIDFSRLKTGIYYQTIIEDKSGWYWGNNKDGLWGICIHLRKKNHLINGAAYEFINTTDQSGLHVVYWLLNGTKYYTPVNGGVIHYAGGNDNYFNHGLYKFGWTYHEMTIGTPLITSPALLNNNNIENEYLSNNKLTGHHFSVEGQYRYLIYKLFVTYTLNYGTNMQPINPASQQYSILLSIQFSEKLPWGLDAEILFAYDYGKLLGNNAGLKISFSKKGYLSRD